MENMGYDGNQPTPGIPDSGPRSVFSDPAHTPSRVEDADETVSNFFK